MQLLIQLVNMGRAYYFTLLQGLQKSMKKEKIIKLMILIPGIGLF